MNISPTSHPLDIQNIRADFPVLQREVKPGVPLIYLDSTATSQKPRAVLDVMDKYYRYYNANVHRGIHTLAEEATAGYEGARKLVAEFINAKSHREVIFTSNTTEAINIVAQVWGRANVGPDDVIVLTEMEHHSNLVPWQMIAAETGARLEFLPVTDDGLLELSVLDDLLDKEPKIVSLTHVSNVLGTINPVAEITAKAHDAGAIVLVDGAQSVPHMPVDMQKLDVDFYAFSSHKMCGPTGIGVLWGREEFLDTMPPFLGGGEMIKRVYLREFAPNELPHKFEAGTPPIAEAIGLGAEINYLSSIGMESIHAHECALIRYGLERLQEIPGITVYGPTGEHVPRGGVAAFTFDDIHPHDVAQVLDTYGIAVRAGHHCAMPLHDRFNIVATARASFYLYNTSEEADRLIDGLYGVKKLFS